MDDRTCDALKLGNQLCFPLYACSIRCSGGRRRYDRAAQARLQLRE